MAGLEHVSLANDACGAPVVSQCIAPWELFDGRLFHFKYLAAVARNYSSISQLLDHVAQQGDAERLRAATLENLSSRGQLNSFFAHNPFSTPQEYFDARSRTLKHLRGPLGTTIALLLILLPPRTDLLRAFYWFNTVYSSTSPSTGYW